MAIPWTPKLKPIEVDPDSSKDWTFDFSEFVANEGRDVLSYEVLSSGDLQATDDTRSGAEVSFWLTPPAEGGEGTVTVRFRLDTAPVFSDDFSIRFRGKHQ